MRNMKQQTKLYTIDELCTSIFEDNLEHFEYMDVMSAGDCDCRLCTTLGVIQEYWGE
jgi:hypothetical protein